MITSNISISQFLSDISSITDMSEKCSKLNAYVAGLQRELKKVEAFKHQLPICNLLLIQAMEELNKEEIPGCRKKEISPGNVEWLPTAAAAAEDMDMKDWMSSVTLSLKPDQQQGGIIMKEEKEIINSGQFLNIKDNSFMGTSSEIIKNNMNWNNNGGRTVVVDREMMMISELKPYNKKKQRRCWSPELHRLFINALDQLGGPRRATPKYIRDIMQVEDLTNDEVKSHLQKYRMHIPKSPTFGLRTNSKQFSWIS